MSETLLNGAIKCRVIGSTQNLALLLLGSILLIWAIHNSAITTLFQASTSPQLTTHFPSQSTVTSTWVQSELERNFSGHLLDRWKQPGGSPCSDSKPVDIQVPGIDRSPAISLPAGNANEIFFQAIDADGSPRCSGGDFFEIDLSGERWKSRPPTKDHGNGSYSFILQVHPDFAGEFNLTIIHLFRLFQGLRKSPTRFAVDSLLRHIPISFTRPGSELPPLPLCKRPDFNRTLWSGRWTRHAQNDDCQISDDGRYRCLRPDFPCPDPWCSGSLGSIESNGWVYSAHCQFKLFSNAEAWKCLSNKWLLWWGDSNHVDTVRNLLFFLLGIPELQTVTRRFDKNFTNPVDGSQSIRVTSIFNGHWDEKGNYEGLNSLSDRSYRDLIRSYFNGSETRPDAVIFNSGLHDALRWKSIRRFAMAAEFAAEFWAEAVGAAAVRPRFVFRSTVAVGGEARTWAFNPNKMEAFNGVLLDKLREKGLVDATVDDFDITWPWHFDNRCNDGVHYGRFPAKLRWRDGQIGHQYFVDLMLGHVLLNAICAK